MSPSELSPLNQRELRKLILSIRANADRLDLFLAICDDRNLQAALIQHYETELRQQGIATYQIRLELKQPSLKATLANLVAREPELQVGQQAVVTVLGGTDLLGVRLTEEQSEQEKFFFSLQWTRESLREFRFPVVIWLSDAVTTGIARQAQDFWSWRSGVFEFEPAFPLISTPALREASLQREESEPASTDSIPDLTQQIAEVTQQNPKSPLLVTLYNDLGNAYKKIYAYEQALQAYEQALTLAQTLKDQAGQARSLLNLGITLNDYGRYVKAIDFYEQALAIYRAIGDRRGKAASLGNLGIAHDSLGNISRRSSFISSR